jgi:hypothetical protein
MMEYSCGVKMHHFISTVLIAASAVCSCKDARRGQSSANESAVPDGQVVLLKRNNEVAAFVLQNQRMKPEQTDYYWFYRSDAGGTFRLGDPALSVGFVSNATQVSFSTFAVQWSINTTGVGWVYFSAGPTDFGKAAAYVMCVTGETNLAAIDANDGRWRYRARPGVNVRALIESQVK